MRVRAVLLAVLPPLVLGAALVAGWEAVVRGFDIEPYFAPSPTSVARAFADNVDLVWNAAQVSGGNALFGLVAGIVLGVLGSFLLMRFAILNELVSPLAIALNAIPIVVVVSVLQRMYPSTSEMPRRLIVMLIVFFIVLVNVSKGLRGVTNTHLELLRSLAASPSVVLVKARIPNALPFFFTALKLAAPAAVITAFVAEYFGGRQNGLGFFISSNFSSSKTANAWAYVLGACALGLAFYLVSILLERVISKRANVVSPTISSSRGPAPGGA